MKKLKKMFFIKEYSCGYTGENNVKIIESQYYCFYREWTIKIVNLLFFRTMFIQKKGYGISVFNNKREAYLFIRNKKNEYINAKKYIKL